MGIRTLMKYLHVWPLTVIILKLKIRKAYELTISTTDVSRVVIDIVAIFHCTVIISYTFTSLPCFPCRAA